MDFLEFEKKNDNEGIYCRKLGHEVIFKYCRSESIKEPCSKIVECWIERMDILDYLKQKYGVEFVEGFIGREPKNKISSIIEILDKVKKEKPER